MIYWGGKWKIIIITNMTLYRAATNDYFIYLFIINKYLYLNATIKNTNKIF